MCSLIKLCFIIFTQNFISVRKHIKFQGVTPYVYKVYFIFKITVHMPILLYRTAHTVLILV